MLTGCAVRDPNVELTNQSQNQYDADLEQCREESAAMFSDTLGTSGKGALGGADAVMRTMPKSGGGGGGGAAAVLAVELLFVASGAVLGGLYGLAVGVTARPVSTENLKTCLRDRGYQVSDLLGFFRNSRLAETEG